MRNKIGHLEKRLLRFILSNYAINIEKFKESSLGLMWISLASKQKITHFYVVVVCLLENYIKATGGNLMGFHEESDAFQ